MSFPKANDSKRVRRKGLIRLIGGLAVFLGGLYFMVKVLPKFDAQLTPAGLIPLGLPGAYALSGLLELITGVSFFEYARRWDDLKGWQRGVLGVFVVVIAFFVIAFGVAFFFAP